MLGIVLQSDGFEPYFVADGARALEAFRHTRPDLVLLDVMLPGKDGIEVCRAIRAESGVPIVMLTAKSDTVDVVLGLESGADDYIVKPFEFAELLARLQAHLLHRLGAGHSGRIVAGRMVLDPATRTVLFGETHVRLTEREVELLALLMGSANRPVPRGEIFDRLWASQGGASLNVVDVYVGYLRTKLAPVSRAGGPQVATVRGRGFMLDLSAPAPTH